MNIHPPRTPARTVDRTAPDSRLILAQARDAGLAPWEATGWLRAPVLFPIWLSQSLYWRTVPVAVGVNGTVWGKVGVKVAETTTILPFPSVVVYTNGVGPPGVSGVVPGCPTGPWSPGVVVTAAAVVGDEVVRVGEVVGEVRAGLVVTGVVPGPRVCSICVRGWPKALVVICSTMVSPA